MNTFTLQIVLVVGFYNSESGRAQCKRITVYQEGGLTAVQAEHLVKTWKKDNANSNCVFEYMLTSRQYL